MSVRVRMAPSPTGFLHIGGVRTFLFNWLFARGHAGECLLRIENTDITREVEQAVAQIERSLSWLGIDWDGPTRFQLDRIERAADEARRLVVDGSAYEDGGAIRIRMPDTGVTGWNDAVKGWIEFPNDKLEDLVLVRSDGRPTYNFASPLDDWLDGITHVIRGDDHVSNTPKQLRVLEALGAETPVYAHVPNVFGADGRKLSKRHGAVSVDEFRADGYLPDALVNFLALLGWSYDDRTTIMSRDELVDRFTLERVGSSPPTFDYEKLEWMNGVYIRDLSPEAFVERMLPWLEAAGLATAEDVASRPEWFARLAPLVAERTKCLDEVAPRVRFLFVEPEIEDASREKVLGAEGAGRSLQAAADALSACAWDAESIEAALRTVPESLGLKPKAVFQAIRVAVTGSTVSPPLFESIELLGREKTLARLSAARPLAAE